MGNTPSTPPPLVSINAPGNDVLVPYGTSLYACPPTTAGYHPPHQYCDHQRAARSGATYQHFQAAPPGPVYPRNPTRPRQKRHGRAEPDVRIRNYEEESESTELGEVPIGRKESEMQDMRGLRGRAGMSGPADVDLRPSSAPAGCAGLRGGQGRMGMYPGLEEMGANGVMPYGRKHPGVYPGVYPQGPNMSPHPSVPPQYASHESVPRYAHGMSGPRNTDVYASHPSWPPPLSTTSSSSSSRSRPRPLPSAIQEAINEAIQNSTALAYAQSIPLTKLKTSPATFTKENKDEWGDSIDTCICTTNCKCRKSERALKWYEGMANIGGKEVPVRAKLNTRYVLQGDIGKECSDRNGCKKKASSTSGSRSSSSDTDTSISNKGKRGRHKGKKARRADQLDDLQAELGKMKQAAAMRQGDLYRPSPYAGYGSDNPEDNDPETMKRMMKMSDPYGMGRVGGMDTTGKMQGMYDPMTTRNPRLWQMPPKPGMQIRVENDGYGTDHEDMKGASPLNPYVQPSAMGGKGKNPWSMPPKRRSRVGIRRNPSSDSEPSTSNHSHDSKEGAPMGGRPRRSRAFKLDDTDVSLGLGRHSAMKDFRSNGNEEPAMYNLSKRGAGERNSSASPRNGWPRIGPPGTRDGVRKGWTTGKQPRAETDDDEHEAY